MTTKIIHIKDAPKDWKTNSDYVYIGRAGKGLDGYFGNPYRLYNEEEREECLVRYQKWFFETIEKDQEFKERILNLKDKILVCFCSPKLCHGDIIADYVNSIE